MNDSTLIDDLFDRPSGPVRPFEFDADVARVFPDMVRRSVPGYAELVGMSGLIARRAARPGTHCYDLGCSLGAVTRSILRQVEADVRLIAVDNAPAMIEGLQARLADVPHAERVEPLCADVRDVAIENASFVVLNLTLQFIPPESRLDLLTRIREGLVPGGVLMLAEKVLIPEDRGGRFMIQLHEDFKRANGYSEMAISGKRTALERVLVPDSVETHEARLGAAGFAGVGRWFQSLNFVAWVAWI
ncbi:carboxy-S-adenosyl-L-methionine synthase CmoA [Imhoffiella purpurea]|uniref:Carboxy-S-adenosyl-L-methionine synthase n=1 Tax=Imhoffiella purpurea TaxID=1249627 RepID=W9VH48_9GAMM|nr:carboxy-S-adenosyl-L-methionine synthase CmoA [Imhoffiella purpurea]EXJ16321.1 tRNA (uridine-5-oxyacetic acid methyl ester) 34 synthase [Imhoffiella purpurea]